MQIDQTLVDSHLPSVEGVGALESDLQVLQTTSQGLAMHKETILNHTKALGCPKIVLANVNEHVDVNEYVYGYKYMYVHL